MKATEYRESKSYHFAFVIVLCSSIKDNFSLRYVVELPMTRARAYLYILMPCLPLFDKSSSTKESYA